MQRLAVTLFAVALALVSTIADAAGCPVRFRNIYNEEAETLVHEKVFEDGLITLSGLNDAEFRDAFNKLALATADACQFPGNCRTRFDTTMFALMRILEGASATPARYSPDIVRRACVAANKLRPNGSLVTGLIEREGSTGSRSWISGTVNQGGLYEPISLERLLTLGQVTDPDLGVSLLFRLDDLRAMGKRLPAGASELEGDAVFGLASGGELWIDFKLANGNFTLDELEKARQVLSSGELQQFAFATPGRSAPGWWDERRQLVNQALVNAGKEPLALIDGGGL